MQLLYKGQILPEAEFQLPYSNRAFQYGDGFFETLVLENGKIRFWPEHLARIKEACSVLQFSLPENSDFYASLPGQLIQLAAQNKCLELARIKVKFWRSGSGLYSPETDAFDWLAMASSTKEPSLESLNVGICTSVRTVPSVFSGFKGINAPVYVLASREKMAKKMDDVVLLDPDGFLAELTSSNLFWAKGTTLFTPALQTGCVNGIVRRRMLAWTQENNWNLGEGFFRLEEIFSADLVWAGNVTGIKAIAQIENKMLSLDDALLHRIRNAIF